MSTLAEGPRGLNHLLGHQSYQPNGMRHQIHALSHHHAPDSPLSSSTASDTNPGPAAERMQLRSSRRRLKQPDWDSFYKNGVPVPQEVIVIEDTPEPTANNTTATTNTATSHTLNDYQTALNGLATATSNKKRKLDDTASQATHGSHRAANGTSSKGSPTESYRLADRDPIPADSSLTQARTNGTNGRAGLKRKRVTQPSSTSGIDPKKLRVDGSTGTASSHAGYRGPGRRVTKAAEVNVRVVHDDVHKDKKVKLDDDDGHYIVIPDTDLANQYRITKLLGQGTFGKVVQAYDRESKQSVAVKVIRSVQKYRDAAKIELRALQTLRQNDAENRYRCIHLRDCFDFRGHICIVTDLLDLSLFDFLKGNGFVPFPNSHIQSFARQLLTSVAFLHDLNLIHTDLKPENILLCDATYQTFTYNRRIPSSQLSAQRQASQRRVLLNPDIRLIDFGSATFQDEYHSSVVSTRHYRAPEIILGLGWSFPCDIWSIGCILVEFYTGDALFQTHDNLEHLAMIEAVCDSRISPHLVQKVNKMSTKNGPNSAAKYFKRQRLDYPTAETTRASRRFVKSMKKLADIIPHNSSDFMKHFLDLLKKIFIYDPAARITAKEALQHPWFKEVAHDDGSEAAKIRMKRAAAARQSTAATTTTTTSSSDGYASQGR